MDKPEDDDESRINIMGIIIALAFLAMFGLIGAGLIVWLT